MTTTANAALAVLSGTADGAAQSHAVTTRRPRKAPRDNAGPGPSPAGGPAQQPVCDDDPNVVRLVGRVGGDAMARELPSGDPIVTWRVIVEQAAPAGRRTGPRSRVDTIDCIAWTARVRRSAATLAAGDRIVVAGSLHRRFWRSSGGPASRYEVEVKQLHRLRGT